MTLDTSGGLLENIRLANGNNAYTFPPRTIILDQNALNAAADTLGRAEYTSRILIYLFSGAGIIRLSLGSITICIDADGTLCPVVLLSELELLRMVVRRR